MLLLTSTSDLVRVVTGSAADVEVHADWADVTGSPAVVSMGRTNTASITTATTTTVVGSPAASTARNVKNMTIYNNHASASTTMAVEHTDGATAERQYNCTLLAGESVHFVEGQGYVHYDTNGVARTSTEITSGSATVAQIAAHSADTYYGANFATYGRVKAGSFIRWTCLGVSKTAGTAAPVFNVRLNTAGAVGDTSRAVVTLGVQTAVVDQGVFEVIATFRAVGASAQIRMDVNLDHNLLITGFATTPAGHAYGGNTGSAFDLDALGSAARIGLSVNPGTSGAWVVETCVMDAVNLIM